MTEGVPLEYHFGVGVGGYFDVPVENARRILPAGIEPMERLHGLGVLAVLGFDFHTSCVGPFGELVLALVVAPRIEPGVPWPRASLYPFMVATTTEASRRHGIDAWHLPHYPEDIALAWKRGKGVVTMQADGAGKPILGMSVTEFRREQAQYRYQSLMEDAQGSYATTVAFSGPHSEHEDERGALRLFSHEATAALDIAQVNGTPFREVWIENGVEAMGPLRVLPSRRSP